MNERRPSPADEPIGLDVLRADDLLLDALGRGEPGGDDESVAALLAAWRADVAGEPADDENLAEVIPITRARRRHGVRLGVAAAVLAVVTGGTGAAAAQATPGSPLWPITHVVNPDRVRLLDAESAIADARKAAGQARAADAQRLVDRAAELVAKVRDPHDAARLRAELDEVRQLLATVGAPGVPGASTPGTSTAPGASPSAGTGPGATPGTGQDGGQPGPTPGPTGGGEAPLPLPSLPVPTPSLPLPLPTLPALGQ
jgi:anti-sigma-D factor RsdA-like protein